MSALQVPLGHSECSHCSSDHLVSPLEWGSTASLVCGENVSRQVSMVLQLRSKGVVVVPAPVTQQFGTVWVHFSWKVQCLCVSMGSLKAVEKHFSVPWHHKSLQGSLSQGWVREGFRLPGTSLRAVKRQ